MHIAVVREVDIIPDLEAYMARRAGRALETPALTIITGPSRTADIELTITLGVHGPGELIVVVGP